MRYQVITEICFFQIEEDDLLTVLVKAATDMLQQTARGNDSYYLFRCKKMRHMISKRASGGGGTEEVITDDETPDMTNMSFIKFHENVEIIRFPGIEQVYKAYTEDVKSYLTCSFGVLLFLYSVMLTRVSFF